MKPKAIRQAEALGDLYNSMHALLRKYVDASSEATMFDELYQLVEKYGPEAVKFITWTMFEDAEAYKKAKDKMISASITKKCVAVNANESASAVMLKGRRLFGTPKKDGTLVVPLMGVKFIVKAGCWEVAS